MCESENNNKTFVVKSEDEIDSSEQMKKFVLTQTDMLVSNLANHAKLVDTEQREENAREKMIHDISAIKKSEECKLNCEDDPLNNHTNTFANKQPNQNQTGSTFVFDEPNKKPNVSFSQQKAKPQTNQQNATPKQSQNQPGTFDNIFGGASGNNSHLSNDKLILEKLDMLRKLGELVTNHKIKLSQTYNMNSDLDVMRYEYKLHTDIKAKQSAISCMSTCISSGIAFIEFINGNFDPFGISLKGWSDDVNADMGNYYDILGEIYERRKKMAGTQMAPELKLAGMLFLSAAKYGLGNKISSNPEIITNILGFGSNSQNMDPKIVEEMRQKAFADKARRETEEKNKKYNEKAMCEHNVATKNASDLQMLREQELAFLREEKELQKRKSQLEELKFKLSQRQDTQTANSESHAKHCRTTDVTASAQNCNRNPNYNLNMLVNNSALRVANLQTNIKNLKSSVIDLENKIHETCTENQTDQNQSKSNIFDKTMSRLAQEQNDSDNSTSAKLNSIMKTEAKTDNKTDKFCSDEDVTSFAKSKNRKRAKKVIMIE
jgi:hypothetical protein